MDVQENPLKHVAEHWAFVGAAYVMTFGVWTGLTGNDFISSSWRTVKSTRKRGLWHLGLSTVPMLYMIVYMTLQALVKDFKEMWTAFIAFAFAVVHSLRTLCGLWQLHVFKQWIVRSIMCLELLGYFASNCKGKQCINGCRKKGRKSERAMCPLDRVSLEERINRKADAVRVNDMLLDNRLSEGDVTCYLRFKDHKGQETNNRKFPKLTRYLWQAMKFIRNIPWIPSLLCSVIKSNSDAFTSPKSRIHLEPRRPEEIYLGWACVLVAEVFPEWLEDINKARMDDYCGVDADGGYEACRARFAKEVLLGAALLAQQGRGRSKCDRDIDTGINQEAFLQDTETGSDPKHKFLPFEHSYLNRYLMLRKGLFCKQEFLSHACSSGNGLPFGFRHVNAEISNSLEKGEQEEKIYGYEKFSVKLDRTRESLLAEMGERTKGFGINELEWLTVFLGITCKRDELEQKLKENEQHSSGERNNDEGDAPAQGDSSETKDNDWDYESSQMYDSDEDPSEVAYGEDFALANLRDQLGFKDNYEGFIDEDGMRRFPLLRECLSRTLWGNRNLLDTSIHIDNMLAICYGAHTSLMLKHAPNLRTGRSWKIQFTEPDANCSESANFSPQSLDKIRSSQINIVHESFMFQFSAASPDYRYLEQNMTFLGCSIESLRSSLARWAANKPKSESEVWTPEMINHVRNPTDIEEKRTFRFPVSDAFSSYLDGVRGSEDFEQKFVQMQLLWELQDYFQSNLPGDGISPSRPEAMILCVISFPAIQVEWEMKAGRRGESDETKVRKREDGVEILLGEDSSEECSAAKYTLVVRAVCAPQDVLVKVSFERRRSPLWDAVVRLVPESEEGRKVFAWEAWRNAYDGHFEGVRIWQEQHGMPAVSVAQTSDPIASGLQTVKAVNVGTGKYIDVWTGWMPMRTKVALFELESEDFILSREKVSYTVEDDFFDQFHHDAGFVKEKRAPVAYVEARGAELLHASVIAQELLFKLYDHKRGGKQVTEFQVSGDELLAKAHGMLKSSTKSVKRLGILLSEALAMELSDIEVVKSAVRVLAWKESSSRNVSRALSLIECFCSSSSSRKRGSGEQPELVNLIIPNNKVAVELHQLLEQLLSQTEYQAIVSESYARICTSLTNFQSHSERNKICVALSTSIIRAASNSSATRERTKRILGSALSCGSTLPCDKDDRVILCSRILLGNDLCKTRMEKIVESAEKLLSGKGVTQNPALAVHLLSYAAEGEFVPAMSLLGSILAYGLGVPADPCRAIKLFECAIEKRADVKAMIRLASLLIEGTDGVPADRARAVDLYERVIAKDSGTLQFYAMTALGDLLIEGVGGVPTDPPRAVDLYKRAIAENKELLAMRNLAKLLEQGTTGVAANPQSALNLYQLAVDEHGDLESMVSLAALMREPGSGVEMDLLWAVGLLHDAAEKSEDNIYAMSELQKYLEDAAKGLFENAPRGVEKLIDTIEKAGSLSLKLKLARLLKNGSDGVLQNAVRATTLFVDSIDNAVAKDDVRQLDLDIEETKFDDIKRGLWNDTPEVIDKYISAIIKMGSLNSRLKLATLLKQGTSTIPEDPSRAATLLTNVIDEAVDKGQMLPLETQMLDFFEKGVWDDTPEIISKCLSAVEKSGSLKSRLKLVTLLKEGTSTVPASPSRAAALFTNVIDEAINKNIMYLFETPVFDFIENDVWDDTPEVIGNCISAIEKAGSLSSRLKLATLVKQGTSSIPINSSRAAALFTNVIDEAVDKDRMFLLEPPVFDFFEKGVWDDTPEIIDKYMNAAEKSGSLKSRLRLATLLKQGTSTIPADASRAAALFANAIDEAVGKNCMSLLEAQMIDATRKGQWDDIPEVFDKYIGALEKSGSLSSRFALAILLKEGTSAIPADLSRATALFTNVIDEAVAKSQIFPLETQMFDIFEQGLLDDTPEIIGKYMSGMEKAGSLRSRFKLATLLKEGTSTIPADASRAAALFTNVIDEAVDENQMLVLETPVFDTFVKGLWDDTLEIIGKFISAMEKAGSLSSRLKLATLLKQSISSVPGDASRAAALFTNVIDEAVDNNRMLLLETPMFDFFKKGLWDDEPKVVEKYMSGVEKAGTLRLKLELTRVLKQGTSTIAANPSRAAALLTNAIDEAVNNNRMLLLETPEFDFFEEDLWNDAPLLTGKYAGAVEKSGTLCSRLKLATLFKQGTNVIPADPSRAAALFASVVEEAAQKSRMFLVENSVIDTFAKGLWDDEPKVIDKCMSAVEKAGTLSSRLRLATLVKQRSSTATANPSRAAELLANAIDEAVDNNCTLLLETPEFDFFEKDLWNDAPAIIDKYVSVIEKSGSLRRRLNLVTLLKQGTSAIPKNPSRAAALLANVIDEAVQKKRVLLIAKQVFDNVQKGIWDDAPVLVNKYMSVIEKEGTLRLRLKLARILKRGTSTIPANSSRAAALLTNVINEAMQKNDLRVLQRTAFNVFEKELWDDTPEVFDKYMCAMEKSGNLRWRLFLAKVLKQGTSTIPANPSRAAALFTNVIDEAVDKNRMLFLEIPKFVIAGKGLWDDTPEVFDKYISALEKSGSLSSRSKLATLLKEGASTISADPSRAAALFINAVDEAVDKEYMWLLETPEFDVTEKGLRDDTPEFIDEYMSVVEKLGSLS